MKLMVCPHDTAKDPDKWFLFAAYLSKQFQISTKYHQCMDFAEFHEKMTEADIIYANPQDSLTLVEKYHYIPLVHSTNLYDEIVYIANSEVENDSIKDLDKQECLSCNQMMVTRVGLKALIEQQLLPEKIFNRDSWLSVLTAVYKGEKPYGFLYKDFYDGLNKLSKSLIVKLGQTQDKTIYHSLFIKNELREQAQLFIDILVHAHLEEEGQEILAKLNIEQFVTTTADEIKQFSNLLDMASEVME